MARGGSGPAESDRAGADPFQRFGPARLAAAWRDHGFLSWDANGFRRPDVRWSARGSSAFHRFLKHPCRVIGPRIAHSSGSGRVSKVFGRPSHGIWPRARVPWAGKLHWRQRAVMDLPEPLFAGHGHDSLPASTDRVTFHAGLSNRGSPATGLVILSKVIYGVTRIRGSSASRARRPSGFSPSTSDNRQKAEAPAPYFAARLLTIGLRGRQHAGPRKLSGGCAPSPT